jgi:hypothetical protein
MYVCMYVCMCVSVCVCVCVCVCVYVYMYVRIPFNSNTRASVSGCSVCGLKLLVYEALSY